MTLSLLRLHDQGGSDEGAQLVEAGPVLWQRRSPQDQALHGTHGAEPNGDVGAITGTAYTGSGPGRPRRPRRGSRKRGGRIGDVVLRGEVREVARAQAVTAEVECDAGDAESVDERLRARRVGLLRARQPINEHDRGAVRARRGEEPGRQSRPAEGMRNADTGLLTAGRSGHGSRSPDQVRCQ